LRVWRLLCILFVAASLVWVYPPSTPKRSALCCAASCSRSSARVCACTDVHFAKLRKVLPTHIYMLRNTLDLPRTYARIRAVIVREAKRGRQKTTERIDGQRSNGKVGEKRAYEPASDGRRERARSSKGARERGAATVKAAEAQAQPLESWYAWQRVTGARSASVSMYRCCYALDRGCCAFAL